jgi:bifunctional DNA-binding transcriptional regulator/antitoxin component of YhaV-PrlF toxin-antitoxin module
MKTTLTAGGQIGIPLEIRRHDHLEAGDEFDLDRVVSGHYLLTRLQGPPRSFTIETAEDGLPVIRANGGTLTTLDEPLAQALADEPGVVTQIH